MKEAARSLARRFVGWLVGSFSSTYPCHSLYLDMSPFNNCRRKCHWPQGAQIEYKQHWMGFRQGVWIIGICQPPPGGVVSGPGENKKTIGKAMGDPQTQIQSATYSMAGLITSNPSAKHP